MAATDSTSNPGVDMFNTFWTDFWKNAAQVGVTPPPTSPEMVNQMRRAFFDALAQHAEQFMRSEAFLKSMKQSMDNALAFQQEVNNAMQRGLSSARMPSSSDSGHLGLLVRGMEERVLARLDQLAARVDRIEGKPPAAGAARPARNGQPRAKAVSGQKKKTARTMKKK